MYTYSRNQLLSVICHLRQNSVIEAETYDGANGIQHATHGGLILGVANGVCHLGELADDDALAIVGQSLMMSQEKSVLQNLFQKNSALTKNVHWSE